jgi:hypothetical protein
MDKKFIEQYGEEILCYRLRTARQKKRMRYEDLDKRLIQLHKERKQLRWLQWNMGWEPLVPPVQKGWKRFFVLRDDVAGSKQAEFFQAILDKINTYDYSHRKDFLVKKKKRGRKIYVVKPQQILTPHGCHFNRLNFADAEKQLFRVEFHRKQWSKELVAHFVFNEPWRFVLQVKPNIIDKVKKWDAAIDARLKQIDNYLDKTQYGHRMDRLVRGRGKWKRWPGDIKVKENDVFKNKSLSQILDMIKE